jgi:hypothetical protein
VISPWSAETTAQAAQRLRGKRGHRFIFAGQRFTPGRQQGGFVARHQPLRRSAGAFRVRPVERAGQFW